MERNLLRVGELARESGLTTPTLRFYEELGLLGPAARSAAGYRLYDGGAALRRLGFIQRAKALGLTLSEIGQLLGEPRPGLESERQLLRHLVAHKLADVSTRLRELEELARELEAVYVRLSRPGASACGHIGECRCWLPTVEETSRLETEVRTIGSCGCGPGCDCGSELESEGQRRQRR